MQKTVEATHEQVQNSMARALMSHTDEGAADLKALAEASGQELTVGRRYIEGRTPPAATKGVRALALPSALRCTVSASALVTACSLQRVTSNPAIGARPAG